MCVRKICNRLVRIVGPLAITVLLCSGAGSDPCRSGTPDQRIAGCSMWLDALQRQTTDPAGQAGNLSFAYLNRAGAYLAKGDQEHAFADYDRAIESSGEAIRLLEGMDQFRALFYANRSSAYFSKGDIDHALADADEATRLVPTDMAFLSLRGDAYATKGDYDHAIADFDRVIAMDPRLRDGDMFIKRGSAYAAKGNYDQAIADANQADRIRSKGAATHELLGVAYRGKGDYQRATRELDTALGLVRNSPYRPTRLVERGHSYAARGQYALAIQDYDAALSLSPRNAEALYGRGIAKQKNGDQASGAADVAAAREIDPDVSDAIAKSGVIRLTFTR